MSKTYNTQLIVDMRRKLGDNGLNDPLDVESNRALFALVEAGDVAARQQMIEGNLPLVVAKVTSFINKWPSFAHLRDDLTSAGFIGLVNAINKIAQGAADNNNPNGFFGVAIKREFGYVLESEQAIKVPHSAQRRAKRRGETIVPPDVVNVVPSTLPAYSSVEEVDVRDAIDSCCTCEEERVLLRMREAKHTWEEIGTAIGRSKSSTHELGKKLEARIVAKLNSLR